MALTPDQTAVLELLLAGQSYSDLEELLGLSQEDVRTRARAALAELGGADPDRNVGLGDYLLGQADPIGRADAVRHLRQDAADHALAATILERLAELRPEADLPKLPPPPGSGSFLSRGAQAGAGEERAEQRSPLLSIPQGRSRLYVGLAAAAVIIVAVVLGVSGAFSGDDDSSDEGSGTTTAGNGGQTSSGIPDGDELSRIPLIPPGGNSDARGAAIVGVSTGDQPYLDLLVQNLSPLPESGGKAYVVWFMFDEKTGYPLSPFFPEQDGSFNDRFAIPEAVAGLITRTRSIEISSSNGEEIILQIQQAAQDGTFRIRRPGQTVLRGAIPRADRQAEG